jgi:penicillin-binding protein 1C
MLIPFLVRWLHRLRRAALWSLALGVVLSALFFALAYTIPLPTRLLTRDAVVVEYRDGTAAHVFLSADDRWRIAPTDVDPAYVEALVRLEDKRFWSHPGVDVVAVGRAFGLNLIRGRRISGASTITMQLVRLLEPRPRTYRSKLVEAFRALQLELFFDKREIMHHYLRFVPYGRNVEGVEAAALAYFGHRADALTPAEIATLLAVPQGPSLRAPRADHTQRLRLARDAIAGKLLAYGALHAVGQADDATVVLQQVVAAPVPERFRALPREVRHAADWLRIRAPHDLRIPTTLDPEIQRDAQRRLAQAAEGLGQQGIHNGAVVVVEHATGAVRALVGNPAFGDAPGAQIAAFAVPRSTGATLMPFLFALGIDRGLVLPGVLVPDAATRYGTYTPTNLDGQYAGMVRLDQALLGARNPPFVHLLSRVGLGPFLTDLHAMGADHLRMTPGWYGLSAAVGAVELTPLELTGLYATLAQGGQAPGLRVRRDQDAAQRPRVFGAGAAWLTRDVLTRRPGVHWQTSTSARRRDAWAVGSDSRYTASVWLGNLNNTASRALVGDAVARPLLAGVLGRLGTQRTLDLPPTDLVSVAVCADTGWPKAGCTTPALALAPAHAVPTAAAP